MRASAAMCLIFLLGGLSPDRAAAQSEAADTLNLLYFGDSITEGWMDAELHPAAAFPSVTDSILRAQGTPLRSVHAGFAGTTTADAIVSIDTLLARHHPRIVLIAFGSNDYYIHGYATQPRVPLEQFSRNLRQICRAVSGTGAIPVLLGLPPLIGARFARFSPPALYAPFGGAEAINRAYDSTIAQTANDGSFPYVDVLFSNEELPFALGFDGVHPTARGHALIATDLAPILTALHHGPRAFQPPSSFSAHLYPMPLHPASGSLLAVEIDLPEPSSISVVIVDALGRSVFARSVQDASTGRSSMFIQPHELSGTTFSSGAYLVHIRAGAFSSILTLIIR